MPTNTPIEEKNTAETMPVVVPESPAIPAATEAPTPSPVAPLAKAAKPKVSAFDEGGRFKTPQEMREQGAVARVQTAEELSAFDTGREVRPVAAEPQVPEPKAPDPSLRETFTAGQDRADFFERVASRFGDLDAQGLFGAIQRGDIIPSRTNPVWTSLYQEGAATEAQVEAYRLWDQMNQNAILNGTQDMVSGVIASATEVANPNLKEEAKVKAELTKYKDKEYEVKSMFEILDFTKDTSVKTSEGESISFIDGKNKGAVELYKEMILNNPEIGTLQTEALDLQRQIDEVNAAELALESDIRKQVEGEAPQSYIEARAAKAAKDLYPKKYLLQSEFNNLNSRINLEKQRAADMMKAILKDEETRYDRSFKELQLSIQKEATAFNRDLAVQQFLMTIPVGRSVSIGGSEFKGVGSDKAINAIQLTKPDGSLHVVGIDKNTGAVVYDSFIGKSKVAVGKAPATQKKQVEEDFYGKLNRGDIFAAKVDVLKDGEPTGKFETIYYDRKQFDEFEAETARIQEEETGFFGFGMDEEEARQEAAQTVGLTEIIKP